MAEYAVFNDEGCIERQFHTLDTAEAAAQGYRESGDDEAYADEMCPEHDEQPRDTCEECEQDVDVLPVDDEEDGEGD